MKTSKVVIGAVAGLAAGAIAGILFAPEKGSTTRQQIKDKSNDYVGNVKSKIDQLRDALSQKTESIRNDAERLVDKGKEKFENAQREAKNATSKFKQDGVAANDHQKFSFNDQENK